MVTREAVEEALHRLYIGAGGTSLRTEDRKKASELVGFLVEIEHFLKATREDRPFHLVDAAAGKAYVGLLAAEFFLAKRVGPTQVTLIEREARRAAACRLAAYGARVGQSVTFTVAENAVEEEDVWPVEPDLVVALHACGAAADAILDRAVACRARQLLLVPCCTSADVAAMPIALRAAERIGMPRHAEVRRRFVQSLVDAERTLRLEAAGYETNVVSFVPPTTTPHNLLWRARRVSEPVRRREAAANLERLRAF
jgi:hypothetical protein